jgi:hypothetical protein
MTDEERSSLQETITQALEQMKQEHGEGFKASDVNLAELERLTGISRGKLRRNTAVRLTASTSTGRPDRRWNHL